MSLRWRTGSDGSLANIVTIFGSLPPRGSAVHLVTASLSGSLTVIHDGPYGGLVGKAVATDSTTGFSFDSPMTYRPR